MKRSKQKPCSRLVNRSKFERGDPNRMEWWRNVFKALEAETAIPPDYRLSVLKETLPDNTLNRIKGVLQYVDDEKKIKDVLASTISLTKGAEDVKLTEPKPDSTVASLHGTEAASAKEKADEDEETLEDKKSKDVGPKNPYLRFFLKPADRAAIWRPLPPLSLETMNLTQKAEAITEAIASNFATWVQNMDPDNKDELTTKTVMKMFDYGYKTHAATSLCVQIRELPSVPPTVAESTRFTWKSKSSVLRKQIERDLEATKGEARMHAFGTMLPKELRRQPAKAKTKTLLKCDRMHMNLVSMEAVWKGITHLRSTRAYCLWLLERGDIQHPLYLDELGIMNESYLTQKRISVDSDEDASSDLAEGEEPTQEGAAQEGGEEEQKDEPKRPEDM